MRKVPVNHNFNLIKALIGERTYKDSILASRVEYAQKMWRPELGGENFLPLKILTENIKTPRAFSLALEKYKRGCELYEDRLWQADLESLKKKLEETPNRSLSHQELRNLNATVQAERNSRSSLNNK